MLIPCRSCFGCLACEVCRWWRWDSCSSASLTWQDALLFSPLIQQIIWCFLSSYDMNPFSEGGNKRFTQSTSPFTTLYHMTLGWGIGMEIVSAYQQIDRCKHVRLHTNGWFVKVMDHPAFPSPSSPVPRKRSHTGDATDICSAFWISAEFVCRLYQ